MLRLRIQIQIRLSQIFPPFPYPQQSPRNSKSTRSTCNVPLMRHKSDSLKASLPSHILSSHQEIGRPLEASAMSHTSDTQIISAPFSGLQVVNLFLQQTSLPLRRHVLSHNLRQCLVRETVDPCRRDQFRWCHRSSHKTKVNCLHANIVDKPFASNLVV